MTGRASRRSARTRRGPLRPISSNDSPSVTCVTHTLRRLQVPGPKSKALFDAEALYLAPGTQSVALFSQLSIDHGDGAVLYDVDGNRYVDLLAGVGVASIGYAHPKYVAAMQRQIARVHVGSFTTEHRAALVKLIVEPIQGTAGNVVPPPGYLKLLRELADSLGALLICDEMITGFGRTGKMFAIEHESVLPDILTVGKGFGGGFPMSGVIAREEIAFSQPWANASGSSSSYGGNPLAAAAARVTIETIIEDQLVEHARQLGAKMLAELKRWESELPIVSDVRGRGLMTRMDLVVAGTRRPRENKP